MPHSPLTDDMSDAEFLARFETRTLESFAHRDHLRVAYAYAQRGGAAAAVAGARRIRALAEAAGDAGKYHDTLTVAYARVIAHLVERAPQLGFAAFVAAHPELYDRQLLLAHYTRERLFSDAARERFVEPDLLPLPAAAAPRRQLNVSSA
jgi:hypothetical protein